jgi:transglutaminase-like putative cysteine protease
MLASGVPIAGDVSFNVIFNPYRLLDTNFTKGQLETFAYDEDEDGDDWAVDSDHGRDEWSVHYPNDQGPVNHELDSFAQSDPTMVSVLELALAAADGTNNEFDAALRLYRLINQRILYWHEWYAPGTNLGIDAMLGDDPTESPPYFRLTTDDARLYSLNNKDLSNAATYKLSPGVCYDFAAGLVALARSLGIPARQVTGRDGFGWSNTIHSWTEIHISPTDLPKQGGLTAGGTPSDNDSWYVFDATDHFLNNPDPNQRWMHTEESIDPRVDYYWTSVNSGAVPATSIVVSPQDWCVPGGDTTCNPSFEDVLSSYSTPTEFWVAPGSSVKGWLGGGDRDIFRVNLTGNATVSLSASGDLGVAFCTFDFAPSPSQPLSRCTAPVTSQTLSSGQWTIEVLNTAPIDGSHGGNYVEYTLSVN